MKDAVIISAVVYVLILVFVLLRKKMLMLSKDFRLSEFTETKSGLANKPGEYEIQNIQKLVENILQPLRDKIGRIYISSGYRSEAVNTWSAGQYNSQHLSGQAADIIPLDMEINQSFQILKDLNLPIDQAIIENKNGSKWIHVSYQDNNWRNEYMVATLNKTTGKMQYETYKGQIV